MPKASSTIKTYKKDKNRGTNSNNQRINRTCDFLAKKDKIKSATAINIKKNKKASANGSVES